MTKRKQRQKQYREKSQVKETSFTPVSAITEGQKEYIRAINEYDLIICNGPSGTGKDICALSVGLEKLINEEYERLIISRPAIETGRSLGALPGGISEKMDSYLAPLYDNIHKIGISYSQITQWKNQQKLKISPISFMRGLTFDDSYIIISEAQNLTYMEMEMVFTRIGQNCKMIISGDSGQSDLRQNEQGALSKAYERFSYIPKVAVCRLGSEDIVRNGLIKDLLYAWTK